MAETVSAETKERIRRAAVEAMQTDAVQLLSMVDVAKRAGVTKSSLYKAYRSKYEMFADAAQLVMIETIREGIEAAVEHEGDDPLDVLRAVLAAVYRVGRDQSFAHAYLVGMFPLVHHEVVSDEVLEGVEALRNEARSRLRRRVVDAIEGGSLSGDPDKMLEVCMIGAFGYVGTSLEDEEILEPEEFADAMIAALRSFS
ncbi:MAG: TetR/AcrR family transcriptional regulator [Actinomycetota bacterium]